MSAGKPGKAGERRSWSLRGPVPGLVCDTRENGKVIRMRSVSVVRELQRTLRKGPRWEGKRNHSLQGRNPEGSGRRPQGLGGARQTRTRVGRKKQGATGQGEEASPTLYSRPHRGRCHWRQQISQGPMPPANGWVSLSILAMT